MERGEGKVKKEKGKWKGNEGRTRPAGEEPVRYEEING